MIPTGTILFASPDVDIAEIEAKTYIKEMRLTNKNAKIYKCDGQIIVKAIADIECANLTSCN